MSTRVRFAPSPTGKLHIGGARTALFNYLFARNTHGKFLVRIEDTDLERSKKEYTDQICDSMNWLGLSWDEELVYQSQRTPFYKQAITQLLESGKAYRCFASKEELEKIRDETGSYSYQGIWRDRTESDIQSALAKGIPFTIRLKIPYGESTTFTDLIYGEITIAHSELDDFIIARSDGSPVYNLTNVVDDHDMGISHVIRGEDHLANTPKQILIYQGIGWPVPTFAHLPMILGQDKKRLSKRHGATGVQTYRDEGYQPEALLNYLSLLGWNPGTEEELMTLDSIIQKFDLKKVHKKGAVFDEKKLNWISGQHMANQSNESILSNIQLINPAWGVGSDTSFNLSIIDLMKSRSKSLVDLVDLSCFYFEDPTDFNEKDLRKTWKENTPDIVSKIIELFSGLSDWTQDSLESSIKIWMEENGLGFGKVMKPIRLSICGVVGGPSLFAILELLGKETSLRRLNTALKTF